MLRVRNDSCEIHEKFHGAIQVLLKTCPYLKVLVLVRVMNLVLVMLMVMNMILVMVMVMNLVMVIILVMVKTVEIVQTQLARAGKGARQTEIQFEKCRLKVYRFKLL